MSDELRDKVVEVIRGTPETLLGYQEAADAVLGLAPIREALEEQTRPGPGGAAMSVNAREVIEQLLEHVETQHADVIGAIQDARLYLSETAVPCCHEPDMDGECENEKHGRPPASASAVPEPYKRAVEALREDCENCLLCEGKGAAVKWCETCHREQVECTHLEPCPHCREQRAALAAVDALERQR